jgi:DNA repair protein RadA/Sms
MAGKLTNVYICGNCDAQFSKWSGRCLECGAWGTLALKTVDREEEKQSARQYEPAKLIGINDVKSGALARIKVGLNEIDRVLGGGIVPGSLLLLAGEPGIGKSTLLAQIAGLVAKANRSRQVIYVSGEESAAQVKDRLDRLECAENNIAFITDTGVEKIIAAAKSVKPILLIIDSIQTVHSGAVISEAGSLSQIRAATISFLELAKEHDIPVMIIGHITKDGQVAGPKSLEHIVDTVLYLESETSHDYRVLRATKNRFGSVNEIGIFEMTGNGFLEVKNASAVFVDAIKEKISGSVLSCIMEGTRPFLIEVQALATKTVFGYPLRKASGFDLNRLQVLAAVLNKRGGINLLNQDIILNVVGGIKVNDPALDMAICFAIASSLLNQPLEKDLIILGEVGLGGEVRQVAKLKERLAEAINLKIKKAIIPDVNMGMDKIGLIKIKNVSDIVKLITHNV